MSMYQVKTFEGKILLSTDDIEEARIFISNMWQDICWSQPRKVVTDVGGYIHYTKTGIENHKG